MANNADHIEEAMISAWRTILKDQDVMRKMAMAELRWLTFSDLEELTGFNVQTLQKWSERGWIRMFRPGDSREWRTTLKMWREDERILIESGFLDEKGRKPTAKERQKRISELQRQKLRVLPRSQASAA